jgi:hypothetical protein
MENAWHIRRQYIANDKIVTEHWNRDSQAWQDTQGGKGYTQTGAYRMHLILFRGYYNLKNLSVSAYNKESKQ